MEGDPLDGWRDPQAGQFQAAGCLTLPSSSHLCPVPTHVHTHTDTRPQPCVLPPTSALWLVIKGSALISPWGLRGQGKRHPTGSSTAAGATAGLQGRRPPLSVIKTSKWPRGMWERRLASGPVRCHLLSPAHSPIEKELPTTGRVPRAGGQGSFLQIALWLVL